MPTTAKLVAAILFAALAWGASRLALPVLPEAARPAWFAEVNAAVGAVLGWRVAGARAGTTLAGAVGYGLTAAAATAAVSLLLHSFAAMVRLSFRRVYDGPVEALVGAVEIALGYGQALATPALVGALVGGGVLAGLATEMAGRRFR